MSAPWSALAEAMARLRAANERACAYAAGGAPALLACLHRQLDQFAAPPDPRTALLAYR